MRSAPNEPGNERAAAMSGVGTSRGPRLTAFTARRMTARFRGWAPVLPGLAFLAAFFLAALIDNGARSFAPPVGAPWYGLYSRLFADSFYLEALFETVGLSLVVTLLCLFIGYPVAYHLVRYAGRWRSLIIFLLVSPLLTSIIMRTFGWRAIFARRGLLNVLLMDLGILDRPAAILESPIAAVIGMVHVLVPFMVLSIAAVLEKLDYRIEEAAEVLGASRTRVFLAVTLPLSLDGVATGAILVFMLGMGSFVTLLFLGGGSIQTFPLLIYQQFNTTRDFGTAAAMSNILMALALLLMFAQLRLIRRSGVR
jgi:putative spermidine/putrescine transport system permease protein